MNRPTSVGSPPQPRSNLESVRVISALKLASRIRPESNPTSIRSESADDRQASSFAFAVSPRTEASLLVLAAVGVVATYLAGDRLITRRCPPCDRATLNRLDRAAVRPPIARLGQLSYLLEIAAISVPAAIAVRDRGLSRELVGDLFVYTEAFALSSVLNAAVKTLVQRPGPLVYLGSDPDLAHKSSGYRSFYSGHTAQTATALVAHAVMSRLRGHVGGRPWTVAALGTVSMAAARVGAGKHFYSDVTAGALAGALVGALVPLLHPANGTKGWRYLSPTTSSSAETIGL